MNHTIKVTFGIVILTGIVPLLTGCNKTCRQLKLTK
jgi:hypothetical protein